MDMQLGKNTIECEGIVCPWGWDARNNVTNVLISATGERDYFVIMDAQGMAMIPLCGKRVSARCVLEKDSTPQRIRIVSFCEKDFGD